MNSYIFKTFRSMKRMFIFMQHIFFLVFANRNLCVIEFWLSNRRINEMCAKAHKIECIKFETKYLNYIMLSTIQCLIIFHSKSYKVKLNHFILNSELIISWYILMHFMIFINKNILNKIFLFFFVTASK